MQPIYYFISGLCNVDGQKPCLFYTFYAYFYLFIFAPIPISLHPVGHSLISDAKLDNMKFAITLN